MKAFNWGVRMRNTKHLKFLASISQNVLNVLPAVVRHTELLYSDTSVKFTSKRGVTQCNRSINYIGDIS